MVAPVARVEVVRETHFGVTVGDPYRWMEEPSAEYESWLAGQGGVRPGVPGRAAAPEGAAGPDRRVAARRAGSAHPRGGRRQGVRSARGPAGRSSARRKAGTGPEGPAPPSSLLSSRWRW